MKGICFKEPLFHLTVQGIKKQTRRIIPCPAKAYGGIQVVKKDGKIIRVRALDENERAVKPGTDDLEWLINPRYKVGEILFLKEPYYIETDYCIHDELTGSPKEEWEVERFYKFDNSGVEVPFWENKLFMPEKYARHFIKITGVRAERLQDISEEDCIKEGIQKHKGGYRTNYRQPNAKSYLDGYSWTAQEEYTKLIDSINGNGTWDLNPFVWVYDYELHK